MALTLDGMPVIDDSNWKLHASMAQHLSTGRVARNYNAVPFGALPGAAPFTLKLIPRSEWSDRIKERKERGAMVSDLLLRKGIPPKNQGQTNYCWTNGVVTALETVRAVANLPYIELSPASVAAPIKNFQNVGGWGGEALDYIIKNGIAPVADWPANAINRQYDNAMSRASRVKNIVTEWWDMPNRSFDAKMTCLLLGLPVPSGYNWWSHETCGIDPVEIEAGHFGSVERNSWGPSYGNQGFFVLAESKSTPDDAVCPAVVSAAA